MSTLNQISNANQFPKLIFPLSFECHYVVKTNNEFKMGLQNPVLKFQTESEILFNQQVTENSIINTIETLSIKGNTDNVNMKPNLDRILLLADISKKIIIKRDPNGKMKSLVNLETLKSDWEKWKKNNLQDVTSSLKNQETFIKNYENGLNNINEGIKKSFQYQALLPEIYHFKNHISNQSLNKTSTIQMVSKLVANMIIEYNLTLVETENNELTILNLKSEVSNKEEIKTNYVLPIYNKHPEFLLSDYKFKITIDYIFDKLTSKMLEANFKLIEQLHDNLQYKLEIDVKEVIKT